MTTQKKSNLEKAKERLTQPPESQGIVSRILAIGDEIANNAKPPKPPKPPKPKKILKNFQVTVELANDFDIYCILNDITFSAAIVTYMKKCVAKETEKIEEFKAL